MFYSEEECEGCGEHRSLDYTCARCGRRVCFVCYDGIKKQCRGCKNTQRRFTPSERDKKLILEELLKLIK